jgi:hypothetical protein
MRTSAIGWAIGVGRIGSVVAPFQQVRSKG